MKKKLHIDVISNFFLPTRAGIEINMNEVYSRLSKMGWDITVHTSTNTFSEKNVLLKEETINGIKVRRYTKTIFGFLPKIDWGNTRVICFEDFNISAPHSLLLFYSLILKIIGRKKYIQILSPQGGYTYDWKVFPFLIRIIKRICHTTISKFLVNYTIDTVRAISIWEKNELKKYGIKKELITYIPYGLDDDAFGDVDALATEETKHIVEKMKPYIIHVGRIHKTKNYEVTINALSRLNKRINYLIVGQVQELEYRKFLEKKIKQLRLTDRVKFLGSKKGADKYYLMKHAEMMVHMSHWESFGLVLLEAMSQGTVCLTSNKYAMPEVVKNNINGYCLNPDDEEILAEKIKFVIANKNKNVIKQMTERNKIYARKFTWDKTANEMSKLLLKILHKENI